jgi:hypothetical protein
MAAEPKRVHVDDDGADLLKLLDDADDGPILIEKGGIVYRLSRADQEKPSRRRRITDSSDDPLLGIIGILDEGEPTDISRLKDRYIADAVDRR